EPRELVANLKQSVIAGKKLIERSIRRNEVHDHRNVGGLFFCRHADPLHIRREHGNGDGDAVLHQYLRGIKIGAELERNAQRHVSFCDSATLFFVSVPLAGVSSGTGVTFIPACNNCRRVETTFSPSFRPLFTIRFPSKRAPVSRLRRSTVLSGFTTNTYFSPCCELITLSGTSAAR